MNAGSMIHTAISTALTLALPDSCVGCGQSLEAGLSPYVCRRCWTLVRPLPAPVCECGYPVPLGQTRCAACAVHAYTTGVGRSAFAYESPVREIIHAFKYGGRRVLAAELAERALQWRKPERDSILIPVPSHWRRARERGFNPADEVAKAIGRAEGLPVRRTLKKVRKTPPQASLSSRERRENLRGAFALRLGFKRRVRGARLCLVDDVATTVSTLRECASVLTAAGAERVDFYTLARTL